jgi:hypothetical protein
MISDVLQVCLGCLGIAGTFVSSRATSLYGVIGGQILTGCSLALKPIVYGIASEVVSRRHRILVQYWVRVHIAIGSPCSSACRSTFSPASPVSSVSLHPLG